MNGKWNDANIKRPPLLTVDVPNAKFVESLHQTIILCKRNQQEDNLEFSQTAAMLSRLIARRTNSFRRMIGFRNLLKINAATCRLLRADLPRDIEQFCGALPDIVYGDDAFAALPTRNCLDFLLMRLLSVYHIHLRIHDCSVRAAEYFLELLRVNHFFDITTLVLAVLAKLRSLNARIGNRYVDLYHKLLNCRKKFPKRKNKSPLQNLKALPEKIDHIQLPTMETNQENTDLHQNIKMHSPSVAITTDISKLIKRTDIGTELKRVEKVKKGEKQLKIHELQTPEDVEQFIAAENIARKKSLMTSVTHRIRNDKWMGVQRVFERRLEAGQSRKAMTVFLTYLNAHV